jgi:hypothetical protein
MEDEPDMTTTPTNDDFALIQVMAGVHTSFAADKLADAVRQAHEVGIQEQTVAAVQMAMALRSFIKVFGRDETLKMLSRVSQPIDDGLFD